MRPAPCSHLGGPAAAAAAAAGRAAEGAPRCGMAAGRAGPGRAGQGGSSPCRHHLGGAWSAWQAVPEPPSRPGPKPSRYETRRWLFPPWERLVFLRSLLQVWQSPAHLHEAVLRSLMSLLITSIPHGQNQSLLSLSALLAGFLCFGSQLRCQQVPRAAACR